jgi:hypothetical protein
LDWSFSPAKCFGDEDDSTTASDVWDINRISYVWNRHSD